MIIFLIKSTVFTSELMCKFYTGEWKHAGQMYYCIVEDNQIFDNSRIIIDSINETHKEIKTIDDVRGIKFDNITSLSFFPQNIENFFKNLTLILVRSSNLQEINQKDLRPFENLQYLFLAKNNLMTIEAELFEFNKKLKIIWLDMNKISQIDKHAFNGLDDLIMLDLSNNNCETNFIYAKTRTAVLEVVAKIKNGECTSVANLIRNLKEDVENLQTQSRETMREISLDSKINVGSIVILSLLIILLGLLIIKNEKSIKNLTAERSKYSEMVNNSMYEVIREGSETSLLQRN